MCCSNIMYSVYLHYNRDFIKLHNTRCYTNTIYLFVYTIRDGLFSIKLLDVILFQYIFLYYNRTFI